MRRPRFATPLLICALPLTLVACGEKALTDPRTQVPLVRAATLQEAAAGSRSFTGTVAARVQSDLGFRVGGKVLERLVDTGQSVQRGQPLMRLDPTDLKLAAQAQQEAVAVARARARQTADDEARYRDLRGTGAISASAYDQVKAAADAAQAQLSAAEAQADVARNASRYTELVADGDGGVMETLAAPGQVVNAGQSVVRLAQATLFGQEGADVSAKLRQLSNSADRLTRTFEARYVLDGALSNAPLGTTVVIHLPDGKSSGQNRLHVPMGALHDAGKGPGVWVIHGEPTQVAWRPVAVQGLDDAGAYVAGQIKSGERIVALGAHLLREGQQVRIAGLAAAAVAQGAHP